MEGSLNANYIADHLGIRQLWKRMGWPHPRQALWKDPEEQHPTCSTESCGGAESEKTAGHTE